MEPRERDADLDDRLKEAIWQFRHQLAASVSEETYASADRAASSLLFAAECLLQPLPLDAADAVALSGSESKALNCIEAELRLRLAEKFCTDTEAMAARVRDLAELSVPFPPMAGEYLKLLSRCYILGFFPEMHIVAGAALELELEAAFRRMRIGAPDTIIGRIDAAYRLNWLSRPAREAAKAIWHRRKKAIHGAPELTAKPFDTVSLLGRVLLELCVVGIPDRAALVEELRLLNAPPEIADYILRMHERGWRHQRDLRRRRGTR